jgi:predicted SprT family Zn-dependent metalloprotease
LRFEAAETGLAAMGAPEATIIVTDNFVDTVCDLTGNPEYRIERGAGVVAAKTMSTDNGVVIALNASAIRSRDNDMIERLLAHEAGHVLMLERGEDVRGKQALADGAEWRWLMLCMCALAIDELRIERGPGRTGLRRVRACRACCCRCGRRNQHETRRAWTSFWAHSTCRSGSK